MFFSITCHCNYRFSTRYKWNEERDYLFPIPVNQRILTGGALSQNPGWTDTYESGN